MRIFRVEAAKMWMVMAGNLKKRRSVHPIIEILIICGFVCFFIQDAGAQREHKIQEDALSHPADRIQLKKSLAHLYFADKDNYFLMSEQRVVTHPENPVDSARAIVEALIEGPQKGLVRTVAAGSQLRAVYITPNGDCYVDLSQAAAKNHPGGCNSELLSIYSVVNSLILNIPEIKRVKMLIEGKEVLTLAGHIDLKLPLEANMLLIR